MVWTNLIRGNQQDSGFGVCADTAVFPYSQILERIKRWWVSIASFVLAVSGIKIVPHFSSIVVE